jgi:hypothetical protein
MKSTGNQFPANIPQIFPIPSFCGAPGCWPYLGYICGCGPGVVPTCICNAYLNGISNCNNGWLSVPNHPTIVFCGMCPPPSVIPGGVTPTVLIGSSLISTTAAGGQPQGMYNVPGCIYLGILNIAFSNRLMCANCAMRFPGVANPAPGVFPTGTEFGNPSVLCCHLTRAVRRVRI